MDSALRDALQRARYVYVTTWGPTGKAGTVPTWVCFHQGAVYFTTRRRSLKARRIRASGRARIAVDRADGPSFDGRARWVDDRPDLERALLRAYWRKYWILVPLGMGWRIRRGLARKTSVLIRVVPTP